MGFFLRKENIWVNGFKQDYFHACVRGNFALPSEDKKYSIVVGPHSEWGKPVKELVLVEESETRIQSEKKK